MKRIIDLKPFIIENGWWHKENDDNVELNLNAPWDEPDCPEDIAKVSIQSDGTVTIQIDDDCGYGGEYKAPSVREFVRWWTDLMTFGFRDLDWDEYEVE